MIQEKMKSSQSRKKSYHDERRKDTEFQVQDHVFLRVNLVTGVERALKCRKLTPYFIGPVPFLNYEVNAPIFIERKARIMTTEISPKASVVPITMAGEFRLMSWVNIITMPEPIS